MFFNSTPKLHDINDIGSKITDIKSEYTRRILNNLYETAMTAVVYSDKKEASKVLAELLSPTHYEVIKSADNAHYVEEFLRKRTRNKRILKFCIYTVAIGAAVLYIASKSEGIGDEAIGSGGM